MSVEIEQQAFEYIKEKLDAIVLDQTTIFDYLTQLVDEYAEKENLTLVEINEVQQRLIRYSEPETFDDVEDEVITMTVSNDRNDWLLLWFTMWLVNYKTRITYEITPLYENIVQGLAPNAADWMKQQVLNLDVEGEPYSERIQKNLRYLYEKLLEEKDFQTENLQDIKTNIDRNIRRTVQHKGAVTTTGALVADSWGKHDFAQILEVIDKATCKTCDNIHGTVVDLREFSSFEEIDWSLFPPFHWCCRGTVEFF